MIRAAPTQNGLSLPYLLRPSMAHCPYVFAWLRGRSPAAIAFRWAGLVELSLALSIRREFARLRLLLSVDAATEHLDDEAGYYAFVILLERYVQHEWFFLPLPPPGPAERP